MLAQQSTSVLRQVIMVYLQDYRTIVSDDMPNAANRGAALSVVSHQIELLQEMPASSVAHLFLRAKNEEQANRPDDDEQFTKDLLEIS